MGCHCCCGLCCAPVVTKTATSNSAETFVVKPCVAAEKVRLPQGSGPTLKTRRSHAPSPRRRPSRGGPQGGTDFSLRIFRCFWPKMAVFCSVFNPKKIRYSAVFFTDFPGGPNGTDFRGPDFRSEFNPKKSGRSRGPCFLRIFFGLDSLQKSGIFDPKNTKNP